MLMDTGMAQAQKYSNKNGVIITTHVSYGIQIHPDYHKDYNNIIIKGNLVPRLPDLCKRAGDEVI